MEIKDEVKYGLLESDINQIVSVLQLNRNITKIVLFGSRAKGTYHAGSDVDLALSGANLGLQDVLDLSIEIDKLSLPYMFDLILYNRIKETSLLDHLQRVGITLFEREVTT